MINIMMFKVIWRGGIIKGKALFLVGIILITVIAVAAYQIRGDNQQFTLNNSLDPQNQTNYNNETLNKNTNQQESNNLENNENSNNQNTITKQETSSKDNINNYDSRSIASKYIEEPNAVAGEPKRVKIGGQDTDVVPVISDGKQVGEIHIDPKTGENVGGAGGAP